MVCWKIYSWATVWGALWNFKSLFTLFYTKMSFKILTFSNRPSVLFPSIQLYYLEVPLAADQPQMTISAGYFVALNASWSNILSIYLTKWPAIFFTFSPILG
jgi:hypothetical protein